MIRIKTTHVQGLDVWVPKSNSNSVRQKGYELFLQENPVVCLFGKPFSGKSTCLINMLEKCISPGDKVMIISDTFDLDSSGQVLRNLLDSRKVDYIHFRDVADRDITGTQYDNISTFLNQFGSEKPEYRYFIVFDDVSRKQLNKPSVKRLCKTRRHYNASVIISTQNLLDIEPDIRKVADYVVFFPKLNQETLYKVHSELGLSTSKEVFYELYKTATAREHSFLFVERVPKERYRQNFNVFLDIEEGNATNASSDTESE